MVVHAADLGQVEFERVGFLRIVTFSVNALVFARDCRYDASLPEDHPYDVVESISHVDVTLLIEGERYRPVEPCFWATSKSGRASISPISLVATSPGPCLLW